MSRTSKACYNIVAKAMRDSRPLPKNLEACIQWNATLREFIAAFSADNPRFDETLFKMFSGGYFVNRNGERY